MEISATIFNGNMERVRFENLDSTIELDEFLNKFEKVGGVICKVIATKVDAATGAVRELHARMEYDGEFWENVWQTVKEA